MKKNYTQTVHYQIEVTSKYMKLAGIQLIKKIGVDLSFDEFIALDMLASEGPMCQRDLAKIILKDRANTGKLLDLLEAKGLIERELSVKNNRPVKFVKISLKGKEFYEETYNKLKPHHKLVEEKIANSDLSKVGELLKDLRDVLEETIDIDI